MYYIMWFFKNLSNGPLGILIDIVIIAALVVIYRVIRKVFNSGADTRRISPTLRYSGIEETMCEVHGNNYEDFVATRLGNVFDVPVYRNLEFPFGDKGYSYEVDAAFVTKWGLVCVECKSHVKNNHNYRYVDISDEHWDDGRDENPVIQNENHIRGMRQHLPYEYKNIRIINLVCESVGTKVRIYGRKYSLSDDFVFIKEGKYKDICIMSMRYTTARVAGKLLRSFQSEPICLSPDDERYLNRFLSSRVMSMKGRQERTMRIKMSKGA